MQSRSMKKSNQKAKDTHFAPAERASSKQVEQLVEKIIEDPVVHTVLKAVDGFVVILNPQRQALAANETFLKTMGLDVSECLGRRPGEILSCVHYPEGPDGCGTSRHCSKCGAVLAILASQSQNAPAEGECLLTRRVDGRLEALEFKVRSTPVTVGDNKVLAFVLQDISASKRHQALERIFFHDLLNIVGGLRGYLELIQGELQRDVKYLTPRVADLVERLQQEIQDHRVLIEAERGELKVLPALVHASEVLSSLENIFAGHDAASGRKFLTKTAPSEAWMTVDITLLLRVLANMVKNALEAVDEGGIVTAGFEWRQDRPGFWVHNPGVIPEDIALQIFQRSFSTKEGLGRGLGTYSMKLIGENYLQAEVSFSSTDEDGTYFYILLPPSAKKE